MYQGNVGGLVPFLSSMGLECPGYHNPADYGTYRPIDRCEWNLNDTEGHRFSNQRFCAVMEVACGEHGECVHKLVMAVNNGKCANYQHHQATINAVQTVSNDIAKESPQQETKSETALIPNGVAKQPNGGTVINMPISCTTSLLDSAESIEMKVGFPTNSCTQFWILLKRIFLSQIRDMVSRDRSAYERANRSMRKGDCDWTEWKRGALESLDAMYCSYVRKRPT